LTSHDELSILLTKINSGKTTDRELAAAYVSRTTVNTIDEVNKDGRKAGMKKGEGTERKCTWHLH